MSAAVQQRSHRTQAKVVSLVPDQEGSRASSSASSSATCVQCHLVQSVFFCTICLSERIVLQHADFRRLNEARQKARDRVAISLGLVPAPLLGETRLADPFGEPATSTKHADYHHQRWSREISASHHGASIHDREARATISTLQMEMSENAKLRVSLQRKNQESKHRAAEQRFMLRRRRELLQTVREASQTQVGETSSSSSSTNVSQHHVARLKEDLKLLQAESKEVAAEAMRVRAKLARGALSIFDIRGPPSSAASARLTSKPAITPTSAARTQRSRERYSAGAFAIDFSSAFDLGKSVREGKAKETSTNDWTILGLPLPVPSDIKRIDRAAINGSIHHTVQLLQMVTAYLGITLPFIFSTQGNLPHVRANPLWGAGAKETLHISEAAYSAICQSGPTTSTVGAMGASMMSSLGASTLSTLESFVQLPSAKNLPWGKSNPLEATSKSPSGGQTSRRIGDEHQLADSSSAPQPSEDAETLSAKRFCTALTMLSFDVAYLVHLQGIKIDLVMAAGSILRLLSRALQSPDLGKRSHTAYLPISNISTVQFGAVDFAQLSQVHEPGSNAGDGEAGVKRVMASKAIMEGSYVDAKKAAESILDLDRQHKRKGEPSMASSSAKAPPVPVLRPPVLASRPDKMSSLAAERVQPGGIPRAGGRGGEREVAGGTENKSKSINTGLAKNAVPQAPKTLEFLRARGQKDRRSTSGTAADNVSYSQVSKGTPSSAVASPADSSIDTATVTITFNGKAIRGKTKSSIRAAESAKMEEDGWHVL